MNKNLSLLITASTLLGCGQGYDEATSAAVSAVTVSGVTFVSGTGIAEEHCRLPATLLAQVGAGRQVRLVRSNPAGLALCTVDAVAAAQVDGEAPRAEMDAASLRGRFNLSSGAALEVPSVTVSNQLVGGVEGPIAVQQTGTSPSFTFAAPDVQEWRSQTVPASANRVAYTAPHGIIETGTHNQVTAALGASWSAGWIGMYRQTSTSAGFAQFHTTSTELSGLSFPGLGAMLSAGFRYAVSFHGFGDCAGCGDVFVGGGEDPTFRGGVAEMLREALLPLSGVTPTVVVAAPGADLGGAAALNFVNVLAGGHGLQLEQSLAVRQSVTWRTAVASSVRTYMDCLIEGADVPTGALSIAAPTYSADVASYVGGACPRAMVEIAADAAPAVITGEGASCAVGARAHVDVFRRRGDGSFQRVGGGYRAGVQGASGCVWSDEAGYVTPSGEGASAGFFRVVVRANQADGSIQPARVRANS
ncbi:MAG: hypothetical protein EPO40_25410 [Myxococcaceae bacterium]|nr:MAG: hypothetical protein EPO40_25410 [Myxococcaceae bacterium]